jgi:NAD(P)H-nitrite reductase large subunit
MAGSLISLNRIKVVLHHPIGRSHPVAVCCNYNDIVGPDDKICYCYNVPFRKLWNYACRRRLQRASQLSECLGAGTGCGWCIPILKRIFTQAQEQGCGEREPREFDPTGLTADEYARQRQDYIRDNRPRNQF